jgi:5-methylcytosine-specific restriction enzyme A
MAAGPDWTNQELEAAAEAYLWMLKQEQDDTPYSKAEVNQSLRAGVLSGRTKASIEYRMQNVSAVLEEIGQPRVEGYLPAANVGENVKARIRKALEAKGFKPSTDYDPTADEAELQKRVSKLRKKRIATTPAGQAKPATVATTSQAYVRDPLVKAWVLQNAKGKCEGCGNPAPFTGDDGEPFLESHHVRPLAEGGSDTINNSAALCPNCHRRCHLGADRKDFTKSLYAKIPRLVKE